MHETPRLSEQEQAPNSHQQFWAEYQAKVRDCLAIGASRYACSKTGISEISDSDILEEIESSFYRLFEGQPQSDLLEAMFNSAKC